MPAFLIFAMLLGCSSVAATSKSTQYAAAYDGKSEDMLSGKYSLYWRTTATHLEIAINALTTGWVAFGLAEQTSGTMDGSDIVTVTFASDGTPTATDTWAEDKTGLKTDPVQDWEVVKGAKNGGSQFGSSVAHISVELRRLLDTKDNKDRVLTATPLDNPGRGTRVVVAYGSSPTVGYHAANRAGAILNLMKPAAATDMLAEFKNNPDKYFSMDLIPSKAKWIKRTGGMGESGESLPTGQPIAVPEVATGDLGYFDFCFTAEDLLKSSLSDADLAEVTATGLPFHIVGQDTLLDKTGMSVGKAGKYVHHYVTYGHYDDDTCSTSKRSMIHAWAPGVLPGPFPTDEAGFPIAPQSTVLKTAGERTGNTNLDPPKCEVGSQLETTCKVGAACYVEGTGCVDGKFTNRQCAMASASGCDACYPTSKCAKVATGGKAFRSFTINVHYDNPTNDKGVTDDSGMRIWVKKIARKYDLGVVQLGDGMVRERNQKLPAGLSEIQFECPSTCTEQLPEPVTMLNSQLHMHSHGARIITEQFRAGQRLTGAEAPRKIDYYDFNFQDAIDRKMTLKPGDKFRTTCQYKTPNADVIFGLGSEQEMCIDFVTFYPAEPLISMTNGYCGNEGFCGGAKTKKLTPLTSLELNAVRSFPCDGTDATCGGQGAAGPANAMSICETGACDSAAPCFDATGCMFRGTDGAWAAPFNACSAGGAGVCEECYPAATCLQKQSAKAVADKAAADKAAADKAAVDKAAADKDAADGEKLSSGSAVAPTAVLAGATLFAFAVAA